MKAELGRDASLPWAEGMTWSESRMREIRTSPLSSARRSLGAPPVPSPCPPPRQCLLVPGDANLTSSLDFANTLVEQSVAAAPSVHFRSSIWVV